MTRSRLLPLVVTTLFSSTSIPEATDDAGTDLVRVLLDTGRLGDGGRTQLLPRPRAEPEVGA